MTGWLGEIKCLHCGHWQIPMNYCPVCGHAFCVSWNVESGVFTLNPTSSERITIKLNEAKPAQFTYIPE